MRPNPSFVNLSDKLKQRIQSFQTFDEVRAEEDGEEVDAEEEDGDLAPLAEEQQKHDGEGEHAFEDGPIMLEDDDGEANGDGDGDVEQVFATNGGNGYKHQQEAPQAASPLTMSEAVNGRGSGRHN